MMYTAIVEIDEPEDEDLVIDKIYATFINNLDPFYSVCDCVHTIEIDVDSNSMEGVVLLLEERLNSICKIKKITIFDKVK